MPTFMSCDSNFEKADLIILGLPYDGTSSFRAGSRFAPDSIREYSQVLETYSPYLALDIFDKKIADLGNLQLPFGDKEKVLKLIGKKSTDILKSRKKLISLGGEHLISLPLIESYLKFYPNLIVIHIDAHADLRNEYLNEKKSHATVVKRIYDNVGKHRIYQFGIRSGTREEFKFAKENCHFYPYNLNSLKKVLISLSLVKVPIYLTLDLDILEVSFFPGTGTPEPGGISFLELLKNIHFFSNCNLIGADIVELSPHYDSSGISSIIAAKILREILLLL